ncbi:MAG: sialidase family protein [Prochlorococcaceae cyanobacterium]
MVRFSRRQLLIGLPAAAGSLALAQAGLKRQGGPLMASGPWGGGDELAISQPFVAGQDGYTCYRTPALAITRQGTLLAFCGGRVDNCKDEGNIDVILRRSSDGGRSWGPLQVIANDGPHPCKIPVPVVLASGRILLLWLWNESVRRKDDRGRRHVRLTSSDDDGRSWAPSRDITAQARLPGWKRWYGIGPGHAIVKQREPAAGRIVVPARHGERGRGSASHLLLSDDGGASWRVGGVASHSPSGECTVAELANGSLMLNSRSQGGRRVVSLSHDGGLTMASSGPDPTLIEPENGCQASLLSYAFSPDGRTTLLFSNPVDLSLRTNGRIQISRDDGRTWQRGYGYASGPGVFTGYSDLDRFGNGDVGLLFESGADARKASGEERRENREQMGRGDNRHDAIEFRRVPFKLISG